MSPVRLRQYRAFHVLMQTRSVTRTAESLSISQPAVSKLLQSLEADIGVMLFDRRRRRLMPTMEAQRLHREVERLFLTASNVDRIANQIRSAGVGELRVVALPILGVDFMPELIGAFCRDQPDLHISLNVAGSRHVVAQVMAGEADIGFAHPAAENEHVLRETMATLPGVAILPANHRLASRSELVPGDFRGENFVSLGRENRLREMIDSVFDAHGVERRLLVETNYCNCACDLVANGCGVSIVDAFSASMASPHLIVKPISPTIDFTIDAIRSNASSTSLLVERFVRSVRRRLSELDALRGGAPSTLPTDVGDLDAAV